MNSYNALVEILLVRLKAYCLHLVLRLKPEFAEAQAAISALLVRHYSLRDIISCFCSLNNLRKNLANKPSIVFAVHGNACRRILLPYARFIASESADFNVLILSRRELLEPQQVKQLKDNKIAVFYHPGVLLALNHSTTSGVLVSCLDFQLTPDSHNLGIKVTKLAQMFKLKTVCVQHGMINFAGFPSLGSSCSEQLLLWGEFSRAVLVDLHKIEPARVTVVGNPLHDQLFARKNCVLMSDTIKQLKELAGERKIILLATTVNFTLPSIESGKEFHESYLSVFYKAIDFDKCLVVIKPHPNDAEYTELYQQVADKLSVKLNKDITILSAQEDLNALLLHSDLLVTRNSSCIEDALIINLPVLAFDLVDDIENNNFNYANSLFRRVVVTDYKQLSPYISEQLLIARSGLPSTQVIRDFASQFDGHSTARGAHHICRYTQE